MRRRKTGLRSGNLAENPGMADGDVYTEDGIELSYEDDEITTIEEAFMKGYLAA